MELLPEWAPNIHPMLVHFPIAILSIAILFDFISFFLSKKQKWWTLKATAFLYGIGAVTAIIVYFTGRAAANSVFLQAEAQSLLTAHANWALFNVLFYGIYAAARLLVTWQIPVKHRFKTHIGFFILYFFGLFLLIQTGNRGAKMVFKYGVGVQADETEQTVVAQPAPTGFNVDKEGNWIWKIQKGAKQILQERFHFLNGSAETLNAKVVQIEDSVHALRFSTENLNAFFATHKSYQNVQVDYYLNMSAFNGTVWLATNVQDKNNFAFVSISSNGVVRQGRMINGEPTIFEQDEIDVSESIFVRAVVSGSHFRGYVNKQMVVHGHGDAPDTGYAGLKLEGSGTVLLKKMKLAQLSQH